MLCLVITPLGLSQSTPNISALSLDEIMKGNEFIGHQPENIHWSLDGSKILFDWNNANEVDTRPWNYLLKEKRLEQMSEKDRQNTARYRGGPRYDQEIIALNGDLHQYDRKTNKYQRVISIDGGIRNVQRTSDLSHAYFQHGTSLFKYTIDTKSIHRIVKFVKGDAPKEKTESVSHWESEELALFSYQKELREKKAWDEVRQSEHIQRPSVFYKADNIRNIQIS